MRRATIATVASFTLVFAACGGGSDVASESVDEYGELSSELNEAESLPTDAQLDELISLAPDEIHDDVVVLVEAFRNDDLFSEEVSDADKAVTDFENENCESESAVGSPEAPVVVTFGSINSGDTVSNPIVAEPTVIGATIGPAASGAEGEGHYHVMIDTECPPTGETIPSDPQHIHFGDGSTTLELPEIGRGEHQMCLILGDGNHRAFGAGQTINVTVEG